jgi:shikimate dehydrogenase
MGKKIYGLLGEHLTHSYSPAIHAALGDYEYRLFEVAPSDLSAFLTEGDFAGINVTIPYKRDVMEYLDGLEGDAIRFGAVNTVVGATRTGHNTDGVGFMKMLRANGVDVKGKKTLVLGGGGAGRSTASSLKKVGAIVSLYQRNAEKRQEICEQLDLIEECDPNVGGYDILVNCTGVGMHDTEGVSPVTERAFLGAEVAVDLIYEPKTTKFMEQAIAQGIKAVGGLAMLFYQAYYADCLYVGKKADEKEAEEQIISGFLK